MSSYIKPSSDIFIKYLFGTEQNKDLLIQFINSVLTDSGFEEIVELEILNPFNIKSFSFDKESVLDVKAQDKNKRVYDIEVQTTGSEVFKNRSLFYWARLYSNQIKEGEHYKTLSPAICINILDFILFKQIEKFHTCFLLTEKDNTDDVLTDHIVLHYVELPKLETTELKTALERWMFFLRFEGKSEVDMNILLKDDLSIQKAHNEYKKFTEDEKLRDIYEAREKFRKDYNSDLSEAKRKGIQQGMEQGIQKGIQQGMEQGMEQGMQQGMQQGMEQGMQKNTLEIAQKLKSNGMTNDFIKNITGLSDEDIQAL